MACCITQNLSVLWPDFLECDFSDLGISQVVGASLVFRVCSGGYVHEVAHGGPQMRHANEMTQEGTQPHQRDCVITG